MSFKIDESNVKELVEQGIRGVVRQGCRSFCYKSGACMYRRTDNPEIRCVVGHMIPDEVYHPSMEGNGVEVLGILDGYDVSVVVGHLQAIHDRSVSVSNFVDVFLEHIHNNSALPQWVKDIATKVKQEVSNEL